MIRTAIFTYLLTLTTLASTASTGNDADLQNLKQQASESAVVFLGDSRTVGMKKTVYKSIDKDNEFFIAESGQGYSWLKSTGIPNLKTTISSHGNISDWTIVTNLGVNDLEDADKYVDTYKKLMDDMTSQGRSVTMYVVSVNPIDESKCKSVTNAEIDSTNKIFETSFADYSNIRYIDSNTYVKSILATTDGLHYTDGTYKSIYTYILKTISGWENSINIIV